MEPALKYWLALLALGTISGHGAAAEVLVFGGTGRLGAPIVRQLVDAGYSVTVFARPTSDRGRLTGLDIDYVTGDLLEADSVSGALEGRAFAYVIDASARGASRRPFYATAMRNILAALDQDRVQQFILHGSVGAGDNSELFPGFGFDRMRAVMIAKGEAEDLLKDSGMNYTIIRNGMILPDGTPPTGTAELTEDVSRLETVTRADLARLTMRCLARPECFGKTYHAIDRGQ
jgi:uncharacterized protein YbjT (DUF2867 family)